jgi:formate hydrogenlyase subunit 3/multisubunit Na+/H+ antiporter MnhD subunit
VNASLLLLGVGWPLVVAAGLAFSHTRAAARQAAPWAALPMLLFAGINVAEFDLGWLMLGGHLGLDAIAVVLLPVTAGLWLAAGLFAQHYLDAGRRRDRFFGWFLAAMSGNLLLLVALDAVVFYLGFALMSFASYGLVVHAGSERARHAGRYYITLVVLGEICVISAFMLLASQSPVDFASMQQGLAEDVSGHRNLIVALLLAGFGIKAGVFGLHFWLPLAHPVAPAPASAVLSGAMIKAGLVAWLRLLPLGEVALPTWGAGLALLGLLTAYYGVVAGLPQREAKTVLAYSSVSQMGVMTLAIGLGLAFPAQWPLLFAAVLLYMVHHSLVKGGLFLGAGLVQHKLSPMAARIVAGVLVIAALGLAGAPLTSGLLAKLALKQGAEQAAAWAGPVPLLLSVSSVLTALLMLRFLWITWPRATRDAPPVPLMLIVPWLVLLLAWLLGPWALAEPDLRVKAVLPAALWDAVWPATLAVALALAAVKLHRVGRMPGLPNVPAGDFGIPLERGVLSLGRGVAWVCREQLPRLRDLAGLVTDSLVRSGPAWSLRVTNAEIRIRLWSMTGAFLVALALMLAWLLA